MRIECFRVEKGGRYLGIFTNWRDENTDLLVKAIITLKNEDDAYRLLDDLCTISEVKALAQRMQVADYYTLIPPTIPLPV